jgi:hypothetical protein
LGAFVEPPADDVDLSGRPGSIAGHRSLTQSCDNCIAVSGNVAGRPQVEGLAHGRAITFSEQRFDVALETQGTVRHGDHSSGIDALYCSGNNPIPVAVGMSVDADPDQHMEKQDRLFNVPSTAVDDLLETRQDPPEHPR